MPNALFGNSEEKKNILKSYFSDDPSILNRIEGEGFKFSIDNIRRIVKDYNISRFVPKEIATKNTTSSVFFYLKSRDTKLVRLTLNDSLGYELPADRLIMVQIPINQINKVCVNSYCEMLESSPYYIKYFELNFDEKANEIEFTQEKSSHARHYLLNHLSTPRNKE